MVKKPTGAEIQRHLDRRNLFGLRGAEISAVSERNHLIYRVAKGQRIYALRMVNPESYRSREWIGMADEYDILKLFQSTGLGPKVYALDQQFSPPFVIQEFLKAPCFNDLKPLAEEHLHGAGRAIALVNSQGITPAKLPLLRKYMRRDYAGSGYVWYARLADSLRRAPQKDVLTWVRRIFPLLRRTMTIISDRASLLPYSDFVFHFDGAHSGNTYWDHGQVRFLDWQKVSYRNDPTFTLVRFATSLGKKGVVPASAWATLINAYQETRSVPNFAELAGTRLLERQVADLVWVLWDYTRRRDEQRVEQGTSITSRYEAVQEMLLCSQ